MKTPAQIRKAAFEFIKNADLPAMPDGVPATSNSGFPVTFGQNSCSPEDAKIFFLAEIAAQLCHLNDFISVVLANEIREHKSVLREIKSAIVERNGL